MGLVFKQLVECARVNEIRTILCVHKFKECKKKKMLRNEIGLDEKNLHQPFEGIFAYLCIHKFNIRFLWQLTKAHSTCTHIPL